MAKTPLPNRARPRSRLPSQSNTSCRRFSIDGTQLAAFFGMTPKPKGASWRSPAFGNLLRLAGQSLREKADRQCDDIVPCLMVAFAFWIVCLVEWTQRIAGENPDPRFWTALSCLVTIYGGIRIFRLYPQTRSIRVGERRERRVGEILERMKSRGFFVFHDFAGDNFNVDCVVIGPSGIYAIEIKTRSGSGTIDYRNEDELIFAGKISDGEPLRQARRAAYALHLQLEQYLDGRCSVKPIVVFVGKWRVNQDGGNFAADVLTADQLEDYFERQQPQLTGKEISLICSHLERFARS